MLPVQERRRHGSDEELRPVGIRPRIGHGQESRLIVLQREVFVGEALGAVDAGRARAVTVEEVASLAHELGDLFLGQSSMAGKDL